MICGGRDKNRKVTNEVFQLKIPSFEVNKFPSMVEPHCYLDLVTFKSNIIAIGHRVELDVSLDESTVFVEIYSDKTKTWTHKVLKAEEKSGYCVISFMGKLYLIGGYTKSCHKRLSSCYSYDINNEKWNNLANLNVARNCAECTVFEGKIVVTGGVNYLSRFKSVEAFDYCENKWTYLQDMNEKRSNHAAVSIGNKMFVIGRAYSTSCEVLDNFSRRFTNINS